MNEQRRIYPATVTVNNSTIARHGIEAPNRQTAVRKVLQWFWDKYQGKHGFASDRLVVGDPYNEVRFKEPFNCNDKLNNYLDSATIERVIAESGGVLERDTKPNDPHHPRRSLRRKKRRREYRVTVVPNIQESNTGSFYYRVIVTPQESKGGVILKKRKMRDIKLEAKTLPEAIEEIRKKGLRRENHTSREMKKRSLKLLSHLSGETGLTPDNALFFSPVLKKTGVSA